jgi:hypothetical protein
MSRGTFLLLLIVAAVAVCIFVPEVRVRVVSLFHEVKSEATQYAEPSETIDGQKVKVYVIRGEDYYHRRDCPEIQGKAFVMRPLDTARELQKPCPVCNPPR